MSAAIVDNEREVGSKYIKSGTISVQGGLRTAEYEEVESQLELSSAKEEFMNGVLDIIIGHAESWLSDVAKSIVTVCNMYEIEHVKYVEEGLLIRNQIIN